ncbi:hypothetical protein COCOBI_02-5040 [Coccomyxa sp. Obi]|nr:hypothetical protein COCOBI_02-4850 [Coccomyxa sp. Obi]BDA41708.1 hypothetical protein COCOBI_02-4950 [Coccomyxa sp. Obi]BDA41714.1 hypothetical protein COCOBI_02-5040 [Coccomyxa sp. Obi]
MPVTWAPSPHTPQLRCLPLVPAGAVATGASHQRVAVVAGATGAPSSACYRRPALPAARAGRRGRYRSTAPVGHRGGGRYRGTVQCLLQEACAACRSGRPVRSLQEHRTSGQPWLRALQGLPPVPATGGLHCLPLRPAGTVATGAPWLRALQGRPPVPATGAPHQPGLATGGAAPL